MTAARKHVYRKLRVDEISFVDKGASPGARITFFKRRDPVAKGSQMTLQEVLAGLPEEARKIVEAALASAAPKEPPMDAEKKAEEAMKRLPEDLRKQLDADKAALLEREAVAKREASEMRERIAKMEEDNVTREVVAKAADLVGGAVGMTRDDVVSLLKAFRLGKAIEKALADKVEAHFVTAKNIAKESPLFKELGASGGAPANAGEELAAIAKRLQEKDPTLSEAVAKLKAYELNPSLYAKHTEEQAARS